MPIYEFRCPDGHQFELIQRMADAPPEGCEICGKGPLVKLLHPVPIHFKGSGFYSTDYGRGGRKKEGAEKSDDSAKKDDAPKTSEKSEKKEKKESSATS